MLWREGRNIDASLHFTARDPRTLIAVKIVTGIVISYALSIIDLTSDIVHLVGNSDGAIRTPRKRTY